MESNLSVTIAISTVTMTANNISYTSMNASECSYCTTSHVSKNASKTQEELIIQPRSWPLSEIVYTALDLGIALTAILLNALVIVIICRFKALRNTPNAFVASLSAADLLVGALGIPCAVIGNNAIPSNFYGCLLMSTMIIIIAQVSIFSLLAVALERFVAIRFPFVYERYASAQATVATLVVVWLAGVMVGAVPLFGWNMRASYEGQCSFATTIDMHYMVYFNFFACILGPLAAIAAIYVYIFTAAYRQLRRMARVNITVTLPVVTRPEEHSSAANHSVASQHQSPNLRTQSPQPHLHANTTSQSQGQSSQLQVLGPVNSVTKKTKSANDKKNLLAKFKVAKSLAPLIILFAACWLPLHSINALSLHGTFAELPVIYFAVLLSHANSIANPILYGMSNSRFRVAAKVMILNGDVTPSQFSTAYDNRQH